MLTCDDTNHLDAIDTVANVLCLMQDLMAARPPGGGITLSNASVSGLVDIMSLTQETLEETAIRFRRAQPDLEAIAKAAVEEYRRGYQEGVDSAPQAVPPSTHQGERVPDLTEPLPGDEPGGSAIRA